MSEYRVSGGKGGALGFPLKPQKFENDVIIASTATIEYTIQ